MALLPKANLNGLPQITTEDLKTADPARLNRTLSLLASQIQSIQQGNPSSVGITNETIIQNISGGGSSGGGGGSSSTKVTIQGTHAERLSTYLAPDYPAGTLYYETDRTVTYLDYSTASTTQVWQYMSGTMVGTFSLRPSDLTTYDSGFIFYATDLDLTYRWDGSIWSLYNNFEPLIADTHANRLSSFPSVTYALNTLFWETDRKVVYIVQNASGTVDTSGTSVTWDSGDHFINTGTGFTGSQWPSGTAITINGSVYSISLVSSSTGLTLQSSAGVQSGVSYSVTSGRWVYFDGIDAVTQANLPTDLGENDATVVSTVVKSGFMVNVTDFVHLLQWKGSGWQWGPGEAGGGYFQDFAVAPTGGGWHGCDGSTGVKYLKPDGTTGTVNLPNRATDSYRKLTGAYSPTISAATNPALSGSTDATFIGFTPAAGAAAASAGSGSVASGTGSPVSVLTPPFDGGGGGGGGSLNTDPHSHTLSAASVTLPGDPIAHNTAIEYFRI